MLDAIQEVVHEFSGLLLLAGVMAVILYWKELGEWIWSGVEKLADMRLNSDEIRRQRVEEYRRRQNRD